MQALGLIKEIENSIELGQQQKVERNKIHFYQVIKRIFYLVLENYNITCFRIHDLPINY